MLVCAGVSPGPRVTPSREKGVVEVECGATGVCARGLRHPVLASLPVRPRPPACGRASNGRGRAQGTDRRNRRGACDCAERRRLTDRRERCPGSSSSCESP
eukprot:252286-Prymnesium_polylepis.1